MNQTISIMKGIAMLFVVIYHGTLQESVFGEIARQILVVFFFVAGYCLKDSYIDCFMEPSNIKDHFLYKRIKSLYIPFVLFGLLYAVLRNFLCWWGLEVIPYTLEDTRDEVARVLFMRSHEVLMGAMWFLPSLLIVSVFSTLSLYLSAKLRKYSIFLSYIALLIFPLLSEVYCTFHIGNTSKMILYLKLCSIFIAGYYYKKYEQKIKISRSYQLLLLSLLTFLLEYNGFLTGVRFEFLETHDFVSSTILGVIISLALYNLSYFISKLSICHVLSYIGKHTLSILAMHFFAFKTVTHYYSNQTFDYFPMPIMQCAPIELNVYYIISGICIPLLLSFLFRKALMRLTRRKKKP